MRVVRWGALLAGAVLAVYALAGWDQNAKGFSVLFLAVGIVVAAVGAWQLWVHRGDDD